MNTEVKTETPRRRYLKGAVRGELLTGHRVAPVLGCLGYYLVETEPGSEVYMFSHEDDAIAIVTEHNRLAEELWQEFDRAQSGLIHH